jgi:nicotinamidase-related amidase
MATIRPGNQTVLIVIDVQAGVVDTAWEAGRIVGNVARAVERARQAGVPVLWVQHEDADLPHGSPQWQLAPPLQPLATESLVRKSHNSSFEDTALEQELERLKATHLVLAGALTNWCIRATAYGALDRGYDVTLVKDAHTTSTMEPAAGRRIEARDIIDELNVAMQWLSYPGRRNGVASAEEVSFAAPAGA